jgi:hypothetical protein
MATMSLGRCLWSDGGCFDHLKRLVIIGPAFGFLVRFFGLMVVDGEWFSMWQSPKWNGQEAAFRFCLTILVVLIFVNQPDGELSGAGSPAPHQKREVGHVVETGIRFINRSPFLPTV